MRDYRCHQITGDHYGAAWVEESFAKAGARYIQSDRDRSAVYMDCLPIFTSGRARLLDNPKLINQFGALERRTFSTGRERIDPGPMHDDLCNAAGIALSLADLKRSLNFSPQIRRGGNIHAPGHQLAVTENQTALIAAAVARQCRLAG